MYRALIIGLGERLRPFVDELQETVRAYRSGGMTDARFGAFSIVDREGRPFADALADRALEHLRELLEMAGGTNNGRPTLDIVLACDLGDPAVRARLDESIALLEEVVCQNFQPMFPAFRTPAERRVRLVPIALLTDPNAEGRRLGYGALRQAADSIDERRGEGESTECLVDRLLVQETVTPRGLLPADGLIAQTRNLVEFLVLEDRFDDPDVDAMLGRGSHHRFGTFGAAQLSFEAVATRDRLSDRLAAEIADSLTGEVEPADPGVSLDNHLLDDERRFDEQLDQIDERADTVFRRRGLPAALTLADGFARLAAESADRADTVEAEIAELERRRQQRRQSANDDARQGGTTGLWAGLVCAVGIAGAMYLATYLLADFSPGTRLGLALPFGAAAGAMTYWLVSRDRSAEAATSTNDGRARRKRLAERATRLDELSDRLARAADRLSAIRNDVDAFADAVERPAREAAEEEEEGLGIDVRRTLKSSAWDDAVYEAWLDFAGPEAAAEAFLSDIPSPSDWAEGATLDIEELDGFTREAFAPVASPELLDPSALQRTARPAISAFIESWADGLPPFIDLRSRAQYDPDGFHTPIDDILYVPPTVEQTARDLVDEHGAALTVQADLQLGDRLVLLKSVVDVHADALPTAPEQPRKSADPT